MITLKDKEASKHQAFVGAPTKVPQFFAFLVSSSLMILFQVMRQRD
jgi:hypothetical protein